MAPIFHSLHSHSTRSFLISFMDKSHIMNGIFHCHLAPVPLKLLTNAMTLNWHHMNVNKMSKRLKLRCTNASTIVLRLSLGNLCIQSFPLDEAVFKHIAAVRNNHFVHCGIKFEGDTFPHPCFSDVSYWFSNKLEAFRFNGYVYLCHLTNILCMYCDCFPSSLPKFNLSPPYISSIGSAF